MTINIPDWASDFGEKPDQTTQNIWSNRLAEYEHNRYYFDGDVFDERWTVEVTEEGGRAPLKYPAGLNIVKMMCLAQADSFYGEWEDTPFLYGVRNDMEVTATDREGMKLAAQILSDNAPSSLFWEAELHRNLYGGAVIKATGDNTKEAKIGWQEIPIESFYPVWNPTDKDDLLKVTYITYITKEQAKLRFGFEKKAGGSDDVVVYREEWTKDKYDTYLDKQRISQYSGINPYGLVPFVYIPRFRSTDWYGDSLPASIIPTQDEINIQTSNIGDGLTYNTHPIRWGYNLPQGFRPDTGPDAFLDLGKSIGGNPPTLGVLETEHAIRPEAMNYINFLYDWTRVSEFAPPVVFGEDSSGSQRSGITLEIRMWPLLKAIRRSRTYHTTGIVKLLKLSSAILSQKGIEGIPTRAIASIGTGRIVPKYFPLLPRDIAAAVDQVVKLRSLQVPGISLETSQSVLGRGSGEVDRIIAEIPKMKAVLDKLAPEKEPAVDKGNTEPEQQEE
jgi:hypothetical protein